MENIDDLLTELENTLLNGRKAFLTGRIMADPARVAELLSHLRDSLPDAVRDAGRIVSDRERILKEADMRAESIVRSAKEQADYLVANSEVIKRAEEERRKIVEEAKGYAKNTTDAVNANLRQLLISIEKDMDEALELIRNSREDLENR